MSNKAMKTKFARRYGTTSPAFRMRALQWCRSQGFETNGIGVKNAFLFAKIMDLGNFKDEFAVIKEVMGSRAWQRMLENRGLANPLLSGNAAIIVDKPPTAIVRSKPKQKVRPKTRMDVSKRIPNDVFFASREWQDLRYRALKKFGAKCQCCGRGREDGVKIHVDHVKSRFRYPELQLTFENLQILCEDCNMGKGAGDETDWRDPEKEWVPSDPTPVIWN